MAGRFVRATAALLGIGLVAGVALGWAWHLYTRPGPLAESQTVVVPRGSGVRAIAQTLADAGVIEHPLLFALGSRLDDEPLKAGEYLFPAGVSTRSAVERMQSGETVVRRVTVPEGYTSAQVVEVLRATEGLTGEIEEIPPEGSLLPETYHFSFGDSRADILRRMRQAMDSALDALWNRRDEGLPLESKRQALILASIVERETGVAGERPRVAAVFLNRLRRGMRLQSDPTVIYGLSDGTGSIDRALTRSDLATEHPYNTYVIDGLPPTPIANPGAAAIAAVLSPSETDELYFVADGSGGHVFSRTLAEHNRNVAKWRRIERERAVSTGN